MIFFSSFHFFLALPSCRALKLPVVDYTYEDCRLMSKAKKRGFPPSMGLIEVQNIREEYGYFFNSFFSSQNSINRMSLFINIIYNALDST